VGWITFMDSLNKLIFAIFGRAAADYFGGAFMFIIYGVLFLVLLVAMIWIEKKFFPKLSKNSWVRFVAIILVVIAFFYFIPWLICTIFLKGRYI
jgi:sulfite exporter TauE/SafE